MAPRCSASPGVPARTSRNGASARTLWLAFSNRRPTSRSSVCASSSRTISGLLRHRAVNPFVRLRSDGPDAGHSALPTPVTPTLTRAGRSLLMPVGGSNWSTNACPVCTSLAAIRSTSTSPASRQARSNQWSSTVLPLPRGPVSTMLCGGAWPPDRLARDRVSTACSCSRPVSAGGNAPSPGLNTSGVTSFSVGHPPCERQRRSGARVHDKKVVRRHARRAPPRVRARQPMDWPVAGVLAQAVPRESRTRRRRGPPSNNDVVHPGAPRRRSAVGGELRWCSGSGPCGPCPMVPGQAGAVDRG